MKSLVERLNPTVAGTTGTIVLALAVIGALQYDKLPFIDTGKTYQAYFADSGGLLTGAAVEVSGFRVGQVSRIELDGPRVLVSYKADKTIHLGDRTEAAIRTKSLLGAKVLNVIPRGQGELTGPIPLDRTSSPYQLPDALGDLSRTVNDLDTTQLSDSLATLAQTFAETPADLQMAIEQVGRFSQTINNRDLELRSLLANARQVTDVLARRGDQIANLVSDTDALLAELNSQSSALEGISADVSALSQQVSGLVADNNAALRPALDKLNGVLTIVDNRKQQVQQSIKLLGAYAMSLGESVSSGPFFKSYIANLIPGQFLQPFVDAAFSDLGLDPNVLLPSQRTEPQTGQPATPPLPVPYPRTGQGGPPNLTLPEAITGNPGDPRYPYRPPLPAPPPGGPPPGPPAPPTPNDDSTQVPTPSPVLVPAPNEHPTDDTDRQAGR